MFSFEARYICPNAFCFCSAAGARCNARDCCQCTRRRICIENVEARSRVKAHVTALTTNLTSALVCSHAHSVITTPSHAFPVISGAENETEGGQRSKWMHARALLMIAAAFCRCRNEEDDCSFRNTPFTPRHVVSPYVISHFFLLQLFFTQLSQTFVIQNCCSLLLRTHRSSRRHPYRSRSPIARLRCRPGKEKQQIRQICPIVNPSHASSFRLFPN